MITAISGQSCAFCPAAAAAAASTTTTTTTNETPAYTCPRCSAPYCSLACYTSPGHVACSEAFYRQQCEEEAPLGVTLQSRTVAPPPVGGNPATRVDADEAAAELTLEEWHRWQAMLAPHQRIVGDGRPAPTSPTLSKVSLTTIDRENASPLHTLIWTPWWEQVSAVVRDPLHPLLPDVHLPPADTALLSTPLPGDAIFSHDAAATADAETSYTPPPRTSTKPPSPLLPLSITHLCYAYVDACRYHNGLYTLQPMDFLLHLLPGHDQTFPHRPALVSALMHCILGSEEACSVREDEEARSAMALVLRDVAQMCAGTGAPLLFVMLQHMYALCCTVLAPWFPGSGTKGTSETPDKRDGASLVSHHPRVMHDLPRPMRPIFLLAKKVQYLLRYLQGARGPARVEAVQRVVERVDLDIRAHLCM
jgi:hypothetical protein